MAITSLSDPQSFAEAEAYVTSLLQSNANFNSPVVSGPTAENVLSQNSANNSALAGGSYNPLNYITSYIDYVELITKTIGTNYRGLEFVLSQGALYALNPVPVGMGKIFNPAVPVLPAPFMSPYTTTMLDVPFASANPATEDALKNDRLMKIYEGKSTPEGSNLLLGLSTGDIVNAIPGYENEGYRNADGTTIQQATNKINILPTDFSGPPTSLNLISPSVNPLDVSDQPYKGDSPIDYNRYFIRTTGPGFEGSSKGYPFYKVIPQDNSANWSQDQRMVGRLNEIDVSFEGEDIDAYIPDGNDPDEDLYMPFWFEDFRNSGKRLYFRAFLSSINENIDPDFNIEKFYGRVEPIPIYQNTTRKFSVKFKIVAFSPSGLFTMWKKINNFIKMLYPTYNRDGVMIGGPIVRMKIGELFSNASGNGIPGIMQNVAFDYNNVPWEIRKQSKGDKEIGKVPMSAEISFNYTVLHEENPSLDENYNFNGHIMRGLGASRRESAERARSGQSDTTENNTVESAQEPDVAGE